MALFKEGSKLRIELSLKGKQLKREKQVQDFNLYILMLLFDILICWIAFLFTGQITGVE